MIGTPRPKVLLALPLPDDLRARIEAVCDMLVAPSGSFPDAAEIARLVPEAAGIATTVMARFDRSVFARAPLLRVISSCSVGLDHIDLEAARASNVVVCNLPGIQDAAVAELTIGLLMALARGIPANDRFVRSGEWTRRPASLTTDVRGKRLGLIGMGGIGRYVARSAKGLGLEVVYFKRTRDPAMEVAEGVRFLPRDDLLASSDFISIHAPLDDRTHLSIGRDEFARMKRGAYLINTARGAIIDEAALVAALSSGHLAGAGLDVMTNEPLNPDHPLCALPNVILQPHAGGATTGTRRAMEETCVENLLAVMARPVGD